MKKCLCIIFLIFILTSCKANKEIIANPDVVPFDIITDVLKQHPDKIKANTVLYSEAEDESLKLDEYYATIYFGNGSEDIDLEKFESYCVISVPASSASEVGVVKVKDAADINDTVTLIKSHFTRLVGNFASYIEEEAEIAKNAEVRIAGNFIYYVAAKDKESIFNTMEVVLTSVSTD